MIQGVTCNHCGKPMPEQFAQQISIPIPPIKRPDGHFHKIRAQFMATGSEVELVKVPCVDLKGNPLEPRDLEQEVIPAKNFDICLVCQIKFVREGLILAAAHSGDADLIAWAEGKK
jgi:hypothetical protein